MDTILAIISDTTAQNLSTLQPKHGWTMEELQRNAIAKLIAFGSTWRTSNENSEASRHLNIMKKLMKTTLKTSEPLTCQAHQQVCQESHDIRGGSGTENRVVQDLQEKSKESRFASRPRGLNPASYVRTICPLKICCLQIVVDGHTVSVLSTPRKHIYSKRMDRK